MVLRVEKDSKTVFCTIAKDEELNYTRKKFNIKQVYKLILGKDNDKILKEDEVLEVILDYLNTIFKRTKMHQIKLNRTLNKDEIKF
ncbi:MAG: hypothetical protein ACLRT4_17520 [Thomasclavelia sp.]